MDGEDKCPSVTREYDWRKARESMADEEKDQILTQAADQYTDAYDGSLILCAGVLRCVSDERTEPCLRKLELIKMYRCN